MLKRSEKYIYLSSIKNKKAAMELSISTIVIVVLAMSMLILGLVLVKNIFTGVNDNVDEVNSKVKDQIGAMFTEGQKVVVRQSNGISNIKPGSQYGIAFGVTNKVETQTFKWEVKLSSSSSGNVPQNCGVSVAQAQSWVVWNSGDLFIDSGEFNTGLIRISIPTGQIKDVSKCLVRYDLIIKEQDGTTYYTTSFDVQVK